MAYKKSVSGKLVPAEPPVRISKSTEIRLEKTESKAKAPVPKVKIVNVAS